MTMHEPVVYYECGCCGEYHKEGYCGDCRNDKERFSLEEITKDMDGGTPTVIVSLEEQLEWLKL